MKNIAIIAIILLVIAGGAFLYFSKYNTNMNMPPANSSANSTTEAVPANNVVIQNFAFNPSTITVKAGTKVTWTNKDSTTHTVKSPSFNSSNLSTGDTFEFTFNTPGTFNYNCSIHPTMTGTVIVQ